MTHPIDVDSAIFHNISEIANCLDNFVHNCTDKSSASPKRSRIGSRRSQQVPQSGRFGLYGICHAASCSSTIPGDAEVISTIGLSQSTLPKGRGVILLSIATFRRTWYIWYYMDLTTFLDKRTEYNKMRDFTSYVFDCIIFFNRQYDHN